MAKEDEVSKGVTDKKLFQSPRLGIQGRLHRIGWQILLVERLDIGHANPTYGVAFRRLGRVIQVQTDTVSFDHGKSLVLIRGRKAQLPIKGQGLLQILTDKAGSNRIEG